MEKLTTISIWTYFFTYILSIPSQDNDFHKSVETFLNLFFQASTNHRYLSDHVNYVFSPIHIAIAIAFWHRSSANWYCTIASRHIKLKYRIWKKVFLHLLYVENVWVEFSAISKLLGKSFQIGQISQNIFPFCITMTLLHV